jgi:hypothetical protein
MPSSWRKRTSPSLSSVRFDGPTIEQTVAEPYRAESKLLERFREIIEVSQPER